MEPSQNPPAKNFDVAEGLRPAAPETAPNLTPEAAPQPAAGAEAAPQPAQAASGAPAAPLPQVWPTAPAAVPPPTPAVPTPPAAGPAIADDVDVIEKEWVEAAESIVKNTAGDPYLEEEAVENLQIDYLKKRYGKEIKKTPDAQS
ncbi:hypothetical protein KY386_01100 [Candidatus Parcubacteria bacterium]|nr:hypothetical protein [Candidatus Parcubacteria bacterium]